MFISADNTFYAYVRGGESLSANFAKSPQVEEGGLSKLDVTVKLEGPGLATKTCILAKDVAVGKGCGFNDVIAPQTGVYRISFALPAEARPYAEVSPLVKWGGNLFSWSINIKDGSTEKTGRVWSELYAARQPSPERFLADLTYYYVSEDGYVYKAAYKGYNGQISTFSADAIGNRENDKCQSVYQSINVTDDKRSPSFGECGGSYKLFFEQPSGDLPKEATLWDGKTMGWVIPSVVPPKVTELKFESNKTGDMQSGKISFKLSNFIGQYSVEIDTTGDGGFSSKEDVKFKRTMKTLDSSTQVVEFDGVDARGQVVPPTQQITIRINVEKVAEIHLVNADVEGRTGGLEIVRVSGNNAPSTRMCWNDTDLTPLANTALQTSKLDGRSCPDSTAAKLHGWLYATGSWGDGRYIDDWAYATVSVEGVTTIQYPDTNEPIVSVTSQRNQMAIVIGAVVMFIVFATLVTMVIVKRRQHARLQQKMMQQHQPMDFPGPSDPRTPGL